MSISRKSHTVDKWVTVPFVQVATLVNGRAYNRTELLTEGTPVIRIQNLNGGNRWYYSTLQLPPDKYCDHGDLLFAWSASFGPYIWKGAKAIYHYHIWKVLPGPQLDKNFTYRLLEFHTQSVKDAAHGVAMLHITKGKMEAWEFPLPPLAEQKRIAAILDAADTLRQQRRKSLKELDSLIQSTFLHLFGDPVTNPMSWDVTPFHKIGNFVSGATPSKKQDSYWNGNIPWVSPKDMKRDFIDSSIDTITESALEETNIKLIKPNHLLIVVRGMILAHSFPAALNTCDITINQDMKAICPTDKFLPLYLLQAMTAQKREILAMVSTAGHGTKKFDQKSMEATDIPCPPLALQQQFATISEKIEAQKAHCRAHLSELDTLFHSLQSSAFKGEL